MKESDFEQLVRYRPDLAKFFHYVRGSARQKGYYRRIPRTYYDRRLRPASQLRSQLAFGEAAFRAYGTKGSTKQKGMEVSNVAIRVQKEMKGKRFRLPPWEQALENLRGVLKEIGVVVEV